MTNLGRLERVGLRDIWRSEASDFTPWLAKDENLAVLSETLRIDLELEAQERSVGPFRADILCRDTADGTWVLVENQLERTDHIHLGQLMTYAAGLQAATVVWIAANFTDEHRAALDWLNDITDENFRFFGLEVELWRIGHSLAAPKFNIVSNPNDWSKKVHSARQKIDEGSLSPVRQQQLRFWTEFAAAIAESESPIDPTKPYPQHWYQVSIGRTGFQLAATVSMVYGSSIGAELFIGGPNAKKYFDLLHLERPEIEAEFGAELTWDRLPNRQGTRISIANSAFDPNEEEAWPDQRRWLLARLADFHRVFAGRVRALNEVEWTEDFAPVESDG